MESTSDRTRDRQLAHLGLRVVLGLNIAVHGLVRLPAPMTFADKLTAGFSETLLPATLVYPIAVAIPFVELAIGLAVLVGFRLRAALLGGLGLMGLLTVGVCLQQRWEVAGLQLVYALVYWVLLANASDARWTLGGSADPA